MQEEVFQFTHPGRGATIAKMHDEACKMFQFTHPGRGATLASDVLPFMRDVSIHAPREGCDQGANAAVNAYMQFQFTHPGRGATNCGFSEFGDLPVSIHAPREGCDPRSAFASGVLR